MQRHILTLGISWGLSLGGCTGSSADTGDTGCYTGPVDDDGDGYAGADDCDDCDPTVYTGATERPSSTADPCNDGKDNDCDGLTDTDDDACASGSGGTTDHDGDTYTADVDCDDWNAAIHPDADEEPGDEVDQDCDGLEECYIDNDDDGFVKDRSETNLSSNLSCTDPTEATDVDPIGDCDDTRDWVSPVGIEVCDPDDLDEDCDTYADDEDPEGAGGKLSWYSDMDDDEYGYGEVFATLCNEPMHASTVNTDCRDEGDDAGSFHPGASDACVDGENQDCDADGSYDEDAFAIAEVSLGTNAGPIAIITANLNGDAFPDLAVAGNDNGYVYILENDGSGGFAVTGYSYVGGEVRGLSTASLWPSSTVDDIVAVVAASAATGSDCSTENYVYAFQWGSSSAFKKTCFEYGSDPKAVRALDLDADSNSDTLVVGDNSTCKLYFYHHAGDGAFTIIAGTSFNVGDGGSSGCPGSLTSGPIELTADDLNSDGVEDLVSANAAMNSLTVALLAADPAAPLQSYETYTSTGTYAPQVLVTSTVGDWNGDGEPDIATAGLDDGILYLLQFGGMTSGVPAYSFTKQIDLSTALGSTAEPADVKAADLNGDAAADMIAVMSGATTNNVLIYPNRSGTFEETIALDLEVGTNPYDAAVADLDGDGDEDIAVVNEDSDSVSILLNQCTP